MTAVDVDVAIVGGGVSGVYSAWRLMSTGQADSVTVFEAEDRIGGRLLSASPPGIPNMVAELGGMRMLPAVQPRIANLVSVLNSPQHARRPGDLIETFAFPVDQASNISYLRGRHLRLDTFTTSPADVPFNLSFQEAGKTAGHLVVQAIEQILPGITEPDLDEDARRVIAHQASFDGRPLYQQGFWQVLMRVMSSEAYQFALTSGGYQTTLTNWNAADAIPWFLSDFGVAPEYRGFSSGFQQVPLRLAELAEAAGARIVLETRLTHMAPTDDGSGMTLSLSSGAEVRARKVILAMPRRALELVAATSSMLQGRSVQRLIRSVTPQPLFKLFTTYREPWWNAAGCLEGRSTTDLPIRQTYYWPQQDGSASTRGASMLMASYDDGLNIGFWDGFRAKRGRNWEEGLADVTDPDWFVGAELDDSVDESWERHQAPRAMVEEVERQLALLHGLRHVPPAQQATFKDWGDDPYGGGWNSWNIGVRSWEVKDQIQNPVPDLALYVCGEAYSNAQGWVEGALQTADEVLSRFFGVGALELDLTATGRTGASVG